MYASFYCEVINIELGEPANSWHCKHNPEIVQIQHSIYQNSKIRAIRRIKYACRIQYLAVEKEALFPKIRKN